MGRGVEQMACIRQGGANTDALGKKSREEEEVMMEGKLNDVCMELFELFEVL